MENNKIKVIVTCANSKVLPSVVDLQNIKSLDEWKSTLESSPGEKIPAIDLYKGAYWNNIKKINQIADELYIVSTGYGLIKSTTPIKSYQATFSKSSQNCVSFICNPKEWWDDISSNQNITSIYNEDDIFIIYTSFIYSKAIFNDLINIIDKPNVFFISPDTNIKQFNPYKLATNIRLIYHPAFKGGNATNISSKCGEWLIKNGEKFGWDRDKINNWFIKEAKDLPHPYENRQLNKNKKVGDKVILSYISKYPDKSLKQVIGILNSEGIACGTNRINRLYNIHNKKLYYL